MAKHKKKASKKPEVQPHTEHAQTLETSIDDQPKQEIEQNSEETLREQEKSEILNGVANKRDSVDDTRVASNAEIEDLNKQIKELKLELEKERTSNNNSTPGNNESELATVKAERNELEKQYNNLLSRISSMKNVFNKMKESQSELQSVQEQLSEYETQNLKLKKKIDSISQEKGELETAVVTLNKEFASIEKEREDVQRECTEHKETINALKKELEAFSDSHTHEVDFQRTQHKQLTTQLQELMLILDNNKQDISALHAERDDLKLNLKGTIEENEALKRSLQEMEAELERAEQKFSEHLSQTGVEIASLKMELDRGKSLEKENTDALENLRKELEKMREDVDLKEKYEKECKDRVLQIGKLRHEAIILNEHLTKALSMLKQSSDSESVDKELMSNLLISFVAIPRADPRKFEVLELISSFLNWDDDKKRQAGLIIDSQNNARATKTGSRTENFVSMWTDYLEKQSE